VKSDIFILFLLPVYQQVAVSASLDDGLAGNAGPIQWSDVSNAAEFA
jgi:hypothetical protein